MFKYQLENHWPPLAWLAICREKGSSIIIHHGPDVDTRTEWFCEAVWDGEYIDGDFDRTNVIFGSGGRTRGNQVNFISSAFSSDRLQHIHINQCWYLSNSLVCLCAVLDLHVDPWYPWYYEDISSIVDGPDDYKAVIETDRGDIKLTYYQNLIWDGAQLAETEKPSTTCSFNDFASYHNFLSTTLGKIADNLRAAARPFTIEPISTCSSGYDSLCVSVLSKIMDTKQAICITEDRIGLDDSGVELIRQLDMEPLSFERHAWRKEPFAEVPFITADGCGRDAWLHAARDALPRRLLLTGNFGGWPWAIPARPGNNNYCIGSTPGLSMSEFRLSAGFLHCPVPCLGAEHLGTIQAIGASKEMHPWMLNERYNRPIPRRIIEQAGIKRDSFGVRKTAVNVHLFRRKEFDRFFAGTPSFRDYMMWIRKQSRLAPPPTEEYPLTVPPRERIEVPLFRQLFPWAMERSKQSYMK